MTIEGPNGYTRAGGSCSGPAGSGALGAGGQTFTRNRRTADHAPGVPAALFARTRNHIVSTGSVLVVNWETVVVWARTSGAGKEFESSIWRVYVAAPATSDQSKLIAWPGGNSASAAGPTNAGAGSVAGAGGVTVSVAVLDTAFETAVSVTAVDVATEEVVTANVALVAPAGTVTLAGTEASAAFALERLTSAPPAGAPEVRVTVPWDGLPPTTLAGLTLTAERLAGGGTGFTVSVAVLVTALKTAVIVTGVDAATEVVVTAKVALVAPAGTVTLAGTEATVAFALESVTSAPPAGAPEVRVAVPWEAFPPTTFAGLTLSAERLAGAGAASGVNLREFDQGPAPPALTARTLQWNCCWGRPLTAAWETATVWVWVRGAVKLFESSTWRL